jgi:hypothetical protein
MSRTKTQVAFASNAFDSSTLCTRGDEIARNKKTFSTLGCHLTPFSKMQLEHPALGSESSEIGVGTANSVMKQKCNFFSVLQSGTGTYLHKDYLLGP